jgi:F1F0 ATPase subunit 2
MPEAVAPWLGSIAALLAGVALGGLFYGGLWWTTARISTFRRPALSVFVSLALRMGVVLIGLFAVTGGRWDRLAVCLAGFLVARVVVTWLARPATAITMANGSEAAANDPRQRHHAH